MKKDTTVTLIINYVKAMVNQNLNAEILSITERRIKASDVIRLFNDVDWWKERQEQDIEEMLNKVQSVGPRRTKL